MNYENIIKFLISFSGAIVSFLFGEWSILLNVLALFVLLDYISGVVAAGKEGNLSSEVGFWGIVRKIGMFCVVAIAHLLDTTLGDTHLLRDATIFFYLANELLSIIENTGRIGVPIPSVLKKAVDVLKEKGGEKDANT